MPESTFQKKIIQALRNNGFLVYKQNVFSGLINGHFMSSGIPEGASDLVVVVPPHGITVFVELKSGKGKQRDKQVVFQKEIESRGGTYLLLSSKTGLRECLDVIRLAAHRQCERIAYNNQFSLTNAKDSSRKK